MIVSTNPKFIFLHIPKTAGTSIEEALYEFHDFDYSDDVHIDLMNYYDELPRKEFESFYKFTVIRNPFNLIYSTWAYYVRNNEIPIEFNEWIKWRYHGSFSDMKDRIEYGNEGILRSGYYINRYPQTLWCVDREGNFIIDHFISFCELEKGFKEVVDHLNIGEIYLTHTNRNTIDTGMRYLSFYNEESIKIVKEVFKIDMEIFGYNEFQDASIGGMWGGQVKEKKNLSDFGFKLPKGIPLNVGILPYGSQVIIKRHYSVEQDRDTLFKEFNVNNINKRILSLSHSINSIRDTIESYESELMENDEISDETISERIKMILELKERELTYRKKTNELIKKLKTFL
jgi:hypothetical protein